MSKREEFIEAFGKRHPECDCSDDEALFGAVSDELTDYRRRESEMADMFYADPRTASFLRSWRQGSDPVVELVRLFGPEIRDALDDPALQDRLAEANRDYLERVAAEHELTSQFEANIAESAAVLDRMAQSDGLDDGQLSQAWEWLRRVTDEGIRGIVTEEAMRMALMAINHERDVAVAGRDGEVRGRNTAIEEHLRSRHQSTDGTVTRSAGSRRRHQRLPPMGVLDSYAEYRSVWE